MIVGPKEVDVVAFSATFISSDAKDGDPVEKEVILKLQHLGKLSMFLAFM